MLRILKDHGNFFISIVIAVVPICAACSGDTTTRAIPKDTSETAVQAVTTTVFLVRHAEKAGPSDPKFVGASDSDPPLNTSGLTRAGELARTLG
ncbi:MAG: hypothetical protein VYE24_06590, partial [Acidobacteriota bacterium]|nr:hypothetical protein [Acidobacteriota bacterium]